MSKENADKEQKRSFKREYCCNDSSDRIYLEFCNYQCEYSKWFDGEYDHDE